MTNERLVIQRQAATVDRYHTFPINGRQNVGEHTYTAAQILRHIAGDKLTLNMLCAMLDHDVAETITGDVPFGAKLATPAIKTAVVEAEQQIADDHELALPANVEEARYVKMADLLEMGFFGAHQAKLGNQYGLIVVENILKAINAEPIDAKNNAFLSLIQDMLAEAGLEVEDEQS